MAFIKFSVFTEFRLFEETNNHPFRKRGSLGYKLGNFGYFHILIKGKHAKHAKAMTLLLEQAKICHGLKRCLIVSLQRNRFVTGYFSTKRSRFALNQKSFPYKLICLFSYISRYGNSIEMKASETYHNSINPSISKVY